jgi:hypothetical protein
MPCKICGVTGHNKRTCLRNIKTLDDIHIDSTKTNSSDTKQIDDCIICFNKIKYKVETPCKHTFCSKCIFKNITHGNFNCPLCRHVLVNPKLAVLKKYRKQIRKLKIENNHLQYKLNKIEQKVNNSNNPIVNNINNTIAI